MTSQPGKQIISINILSNNSRITGNQTIKFGQLIEYNIKNIFLEKSFKKCRGELFPDPFLKTQNCAYLPINSLIISKLSCRPLAFTSYEDFLKTRRLELVSLPHFRHDFQRKIFLLLYSTNWPNFIVWLSLLREILGNMYCNCSLIWLWRHKFLN